ncbi:MAG: hypothetical protein ACR2MP_24630 [Streptosporangiaceae bacterium]
MSFVADDLAAWLVSLLADTGRKRLAAWLLGDEQERALRQAATAAVQDAADDLCAGDEQRSRHQAMVISQVFGVVVPDAPLRDHRTLLEALQAGVVSQLAVLDDPGLTGTEKSSAQVLGVATADLAQKLASSLVREITVRGSRGGPLEPLAAQLNHDKTHVQGQRLERMLGEVWEALAGPDLSQAPSAAHSLVSAGEPGTREHERAAARNLASGYRQGFDEFYRHGLHELVRLPLLRDGVPVDPAGLAGVIREARHVQLTGVPGCGKSHLVRHTLLDLDDAMLPVLVEGGMYDGQLTALIDRSTGRFTTSSGQELLGAAAITGQAVVLVIDGYNECPVPLQSRLAGDLMALSLGTGIRTLITAHTVIDLPERLTGVKLEAGTLTDDDRRAVLCSYGAEDLAPLCEPFATAFELSVAAECGRELGTPLTRGALFAAFVRKRLNTAQSPALVRGALRQLALTMDERLLTWLPIDDALQISDNYLTRQCESAGVTDQVLECSIIRTDQGKLSFTHELLGRFLALEGLRQAHPEPADLARQLRLPRHEDLPAMAVDLETEPGRAGELLAALADWMLYFLALSGGSGRPARQAAQAAAHEILEAVTSGMPEAVFTFHDHTELTVTGGRRLADADQNLLAAIGALVTEGQYLAEATAVLDATDAACQRSADLQEAREGQRPSAWAVAAAVHPGYISDARAQIAAAIVLRSASWAEWDSRLRQLGRPSRATARQMARVLEGATAANWGRLLLLAGHLKAEDGLDAAAMAVPVLRLCWDSGAYHVRLDGLHMIESFAAAVEGHPLREEIITLLDSFDTNDFMLNTSLAETLHAYRLIEADGNAEAVREQIAQLLSDPSSADSRALAYGVVASQFEDIIAAPYIEAIGSLPPGQRTALYTLASLGSPTYGAWNDVLLFDLVGSGDRTALPAFQRWATHLDSDNPAVREVATCYVLAIQGCAQFMTEPPGLAGSQDGDRAAWGCYGAIIFWMNKAGLTTAESRDKALPYWQQLNSTLLPAAGDPLIRLRTAILTHPGRRIPVIQPVLTAFPDEIRSILEWSLQHHTALTSIFTGFHDDRLSHIVSMLAGVGNATTADLLRAYIDDLHLGSSVITTIKALTENQADQNWTP